MFVTLDTSQLERFWSKFLASANIDIMFVTLDTSQLERSWLKFLAA